MDKIGLDRILELRAWEIEDSLQDIYSVVASMKNEDDFVFVVDEIKRQIKFFKKNNCEQEIAGFTPAELVRCFAAELCSPAPAVSASRKATAVLLWHRKWRNSASR